MFFMTPSRMKNNRPEESTDYWRWFVYHGFFLAGIDIVSANIIGKHITQLTHLHLSSLVSSISPVRYSQWEYLSRVVHIEWPKGWGTYQDIRCIIFKGNIPFDIVSFKNILTSSWTRRSHIAAGTANGEEVRRSCWVLIHEYWRKMITRRNCACGDWRIIQTLNHFDLYVKTTKNVTLILWASSVKANHSLHINQVSPLLHHSLLSFHLPWLFSHHHSHALHCSLCNHRMIVSTLQW